MTDILIDGDDPAETAAWFEEELEASARYQAMLEAKRRAGQLVEAGRPLAAKAVLVLAELEADERSRAVSLRRRALRVLAELSSI